MRPLLACLVLALPALALAGCVQGPAALTPGGGDGDRSAPGGDAPAVHEWPSLDEAVVRPGVQVVSPSGQCTSNFVFTGRGGADLYLGLAAHCVDGMAPGDPVDVANGAATGTLAYSAWLAMRKAGTDGPFSGGACDAEEDAVACAQNDFALVRIDDAHRHLVHPAVRHFGGPVALADSSKVAVGDKVLTYGNSGLRQQVEPLSWHEGVVVDRTDAWSTGVYTATPGVPGDSGSGVLTGGGEALGVLVTLGVLPAPGRNGVTHLDLALQYARDHGGPDVALATWELLDAGLLPATA